jgi:type I restriction enzyme S subunit
MNDVLPQINDKHTEEGLRPLSVCLSEVTEGIGSSWQQYRVLGATRDGLADAKESVGKHPERYKPVIPGTIFYNPMRILIGSIAMLDEGEESGITSPDYVVIRCRGGILHFKFFYYWLRSDAGADFIRRLTRGAVRERMLFKRLVTGQMPLPSWPVQVKFAAQASAIEKVRTSVYEQLALLDEMSVSLLKTALNGHT